MSTSQTAVQEPVVISKENEGTQKDANEPLLYQKRERVTDNAYSGDTTSCQVSSNPRDYSPDD